MTENPPSQTSWDKPPTKRFWIGVIAVLAVIAVGWILFSAIQENHSAVDDAEKRHSEYCNDQLQRGFDLC